MERSAVTSARQSVLNAQNRAPAAGPAKLATEAEDYCAEDDVDEKAAGPAGGTVKLATEAEDYCAEDDVGPEK
jgi:hypothetical protein